MKINDYKVGCQMLTAVVIMAFFSGILTARAQDLSKYATAWFDPSTPATTYCNPLNIDYTFEYNNNNSKVTPFRSTADPLIITYKGDYYLFCSNQSGFYWSKDLGDWNFVYSGFQRIGTEDDQCAPAAFVMGDTLVYTGSTYTSLPVWFTTNPKAGRWQHLVDSSRLPAWDPGFLLDDDGKLYMYYGSSGTFPVKGVEMNKKTWLPAGDQKAYEFLYKSNSIDEKQKVAGEIRELVGLLPKLHGWERFGMNNDDPVAPWGHFIEGPWMTKHKGKYYLQYGAPGTEFKVYADGTYVSDHPLGPFTYQKHNPFAYKPGGFIMGCGHGNTFADNYGNYWHTGTCMVSAKYKFERRIGMYPAGFDNEGVLYTNTAFGDYPTTLPSGLSDHRNGRKTGWMLLSYQKKSTASSTDSSYQSAYAFDENISTYWSAKSAKPGEWLMTDLGGQKDVYALQINYADHKSNQHGKAMDLYHQYKIYGSDDGQQWTLIVDKSYNDRDKPHDYVELKKPFRTRYLKLENIHMASGNFAICGFRVFGTANGPKPPRVSNFRVNRDDSDPRNAILSWDAAGDAYGYNIYFGVDPGKLYSCITVNGATTYDFRGMDVGTSYYFEIEALNESGTSLRTEPGPVMSDDSLLSLVEYKTFRYFWDGAEPNSGLACERIHMDGIYPEKDKNIITTGGSGFGFMAILVGIQRKFITRQEAVDRFNKNLAFLRKADRFHGAWPHWLDGETGKVKPFSKKDNGADIVETAYLIQGLLAVRQYFLDGNEEEKKLAHDIDKLWKEVEWNWFTNGGQDVIYWHWSPQYKWEMNLPVQGYNECLITYVLAASSPTYPVSPEAYHKGWARDGKIKTEREKYGHKLLLRHNGSEEYGGPLFWAHYSYLGLDPGRLKDKYADYWQLNRNQTLINRQWCIQNPKGYKGYGAKCWGLSSSYSVEFYAGHAPGMEHDLGVISPTAALSSFPYTPDYSMEALKYFYYELGNRIFGEYGFYDAFSEQNNFFPQKYLAIDQGPVIVMIENYRTGLLWQLFMSSPDIQKGLNKLGFKY